MTVPEIIELQDIKVTGDNVAHIIEMSKSVWGLHLVYTGMQEFTIAELLASVFETLWNNIDSLETNGFKNGLRHIIKTGV